MNDFWQKLTKPFTILAPMDDVTDVVFREVVTKTYKPDVLFTEFTNTDALVSKGYAKTIQRFLYTEQQRPIVAQIWGSTPDHFYKSAQIVEKMGFDGIDINMGCPVKKVVKRGTGAGLVKNSDLAGKLIDATHAGAPNIPISVKTRISDTAELTEEWLRFLLSKNLNLLTLHARTAKEMSKVPARWEELKKAVDLRDKLGSKTLIVGNGDVKSYEEVINKHREYKVDGIMIGRGIFTNPWVFEKEIPTREHSIKENIDLLLFHTDLFLKQWGETKNFEVLKKFYKIYVKGFYGADELRTELMRAKTVGEVINLIGNFKFPDHYTN